MKKERRMKRFVEKRDLPGYGFISLFAIGFIFLFLKPLIMLGIYSFNKVKLAVGQLILMPVGFENYRKAIFGDGKFIRALLSELGTALIDVVIIMFVSMVIAFLLSQEFRGRLFFRIASFLPVIFMSDVSRFIITKSAYSGPYNVQLMESNDKFKVFSMAGVDFLNEIMESFGLGPDVIGIMVNSVNNIFEITWATGIQVILLIVAIRAIPSYLYEVCEIEGATAWESFWKLTFPLLTPTILLCVIYTLIKQFNSENEVIRIINTHLPLELHYGAAQTLIYSLLILILYGIVYKLMSKGVVYLD